ncbi:DUF932 domain-containing protein [Neobacillus sp. Marseille-QA0830]
MTANVESMFYVGDMPWHKAGISLNQPPDTKAAIIYAGLDWEVNKVDLYTEYGSRVNNYYGIIRNDNQKVLGVVGKGYKPLQNSDAFNFFDPLITSKFLEYETAGAIGNGEIIWILAKIKVNPTFEVHKDDSVNKYLLLSNSHDGQSAVNIKFTPIRVVCQNTLNIALNEGETTKIKHITNMHQKLVDVQIAVENINNVYLKVEEHFKKMVNHSLNEKKAIEYFNSLFPIIGLNEIKTDSQLAKRNININIQNQLMKNFEEGFGVKELKIGGTLWAAYNAVTQYVDHPSDYKLGDKKLLKRIWFGDGEAIKKKAFIMALDSMKSA